MNNTLTHHQEPVLTQNLTEQDLAKRWQISVKTLQDCAAIDFNGGQMPDLSTRVGQAAIEELCNDAELIIVDNLSCLARSGRENEAESWIIVADWALKMGALRKCVIFIHHAGKKGDQRGTSKREDLLDVVIELKRPADYIPEQGARFIVNFTKARHLLGNQAQSFEACLMNRDDGKTVWKITTLSEGTSNQVVKLANSGLSQKKITEKLGVNKSTVSRHTFSSPNRIEMGKTLRPTVSVDFGIQ